MKHTLIFISMFFSWCMLFAQEPVKRENQPTNEEIRRAKKQRINEMIRLEEEGQPAFDKFSLLGIRLNYDGFGLSWEKGKMKSPYKASIIQIEVNNKNHPKEERMTNFSPTLVYGKINHFYQLKGAYGIQQVIGNKGNKNGIAIYGIVNGGLSMGMLRPYYVTIQDQITRRPKQIKYTEDTKNAFLLSPGYYGGTGFSRGWNEMKVVPGMHAKSAVRFDWSRFNNSITAIEFGFNFEYYFSKVEQMALNPGKNFFANGYLSFVFGKRK